MIKVVIRWLVERYMAYYDGYELFVPPLGTKRSFGRNSTWLVGTKEYELYHQTGDSEFIILEMVGDSIKRNINIKFADPEMFDKIIEFCES